MTDWLKEAFKIGDEIREARRFLHMHPELGNREFVTGDYIAGKLSGMGYRVERLLDTAVVGKLYTHAAGPAAALRADMDALPIIEDTGCPFASVNDGLMHACGHDVHMSAALGAASLIASHPDEFGGNVKLIFEPDEEGLGGAKRLIDQGVMDDVGAVYGMHVSPDLPLGDIGIRYGKFYAASDTFTIALEGKSAHGAEPEKGLDALYAASLMVSSLHKLPREVLPSRAIVNVGTFRSGVASNVIADRAELQGIIRTLGKDERAYIKKRFREEVEKISQERHIKAAITLTESYPGVVNTEETTAIAEEAAGKLFGEGHVAVIDNPLMVTDDFGYFIDKAKGTYYHLGVGGDKPLHSPYFLPPENAPIYGAALHAGVICSYLKTRV